MRYLIECMEVHCPLLGVCTTFLLRVCVHAVCTATCRTYVVTCNGMCRRYTLPLEDMYAPNAPGAPSIAKWLSTEAKAHSAYNCSAHCGGKQYCGAAAPYGSVYGTDSIGAY